jgi:uncharacterized membrane protein
VTDRTLRLAIGVLAIAGIAIAGYLTYARYADVELICSTGGCETVQRSRYSVVAGVPVAVLGLIGYAVLLATAALPRAWAVAAGAAAALAGLVFAAYLLVLQLFVIDAVCQWCVASDVVLAVIAALAVLRLRGASFSSSPAS